MRRWSAWIAMMAASIAPASQDRLALPEPKIERTKLLIRRADHFRREGSLVIAEGNVSLSYGGYDIFGNKATFDLETEVAEATGQARLNGASQDIIADEITADFKQKTYSFRGARIQLDEEAMDRQIKSELFIRAQAGEGQEGRFQFGSCTATTCNLEEAHFHIGARSMEVIPGKRIRLDGASLSVGRTRIFSLPRLDLPLGSGSDRYLPELGQSPDEGYFAKARFGTGVDALEKADALVDLMSRLGVGLGFEGDYLRRHAEGSFRAYTLFGANPGTNLTVNHRDRIGASSVDASALYQNNNYQTSPGQSSLQLRGQAGIPTSSGSTRLTAFRTSNDRSGFSAVSQNFGVSDQRRFGPLNTSFQAAWSQSETRTTSLTSNHETIDLRFFANQDIGPLTAQLDYQRAVPIEVRDGYFDSGARTPLLTLTADSNRILKQRSAPFTSRMEASVGQLFDPATREGVTRIFWNNDLQGTLNLARGADLGLSGRYRQGIYSDNTAQFAIDYGADLRVGLRGAATSPVSANISYRRLHSRGFTPLSIDRTGRNDSLSAGLDWRPNFKTQVGLSTGYDWLQAERGAASPWQQVSLRGEWRSSSNHFVRAQTVYDTYSTAWGRTRLEAAFPALGAKASLGAVYDGQREQWAGVTGSLIGWRSGQVQLSFLADYNGYRERLDSFRARAIYDLHCTEAILEVIDDAVGFRSGRTISFTVGLKGFPSGPGFGSGKRGQSIGFGQGSGF